MKCPKCGHEQSSTQKCESCGIYFEKYRSVQEKRLQLRQDRKKKRNGTPPLFVGTALLGVIAAAVFVYSSDAPEVATEVPGTTPTAGPQIKLRLEASHKPRNHIEQARNATVFIETIWGSLGSGFLVSDDCWCITNGHVLEFDKEELRMAAYAEADVEVRRVLKEKAQELRALQKKYNEVAAEGMTAESEQIRAEMLALNQALNEYPRSVRKEIDLQLDGMEAESSNASYQVSLVDGTEFTVDSIYYSEEYDLALFKLPTNGCPYLTLSKEQNIAQGTRLYTVGNPAGLGYTVTSGIFSGYHSKDGVMLLQTDAPINPGNSGGPLITEQGRVVGVNTWKLVGAEGIGFAIPAATVEQEFGDRVAFGMARGSKL